MLGVPPKSSGGATNRCVMSRLTKCAAPDPFQTALSQACRARSCRSCGGAGVQRLCALCLPPTGQPLVSLRRAQACSPICPDASPCPALLSTARLYGDRSPQRSAGAHRVPWLAPIMVVIGSPAERRCHNKKRRRHRLEKSPVPRKGPRSTPPGPVGACISENEPARLHARNASQCR